MKYKGLLLDFDDTMVESTESIHYPIYVDCLKKMKPHMTPVSIKEWFWLNHEPGISAFLRQIYNEEEMVEEYNFWKESVAKYPLPKLYPGILEFAKDFQSQGGKIAILSLGQKPQIEQTCAEHGLTVDYISGWTDDETKRKPNAYPALEAMREMGVQPEQCLLVDDLSPGLKMAQKVGVKACLATWINPVLLKEVEDDVTILRSVSDLRRVVFDDVEVLKNT